MRVPSSQRMWKLDHDEVAKTLVTLFWPKENDVRGHMRSHFLSPNVAPSFEPIQGDNVVCVISCWLICAAKMSSR